MVSPVIVGIRRSLTAGGGGNSTSSASRDFSPPRGSAPGTSPTPPVVARAGCSVRFKRKEGSRLGSRKNPRKWGPRVRKVRRTPRKYYGPWLRGRARNIGGVERIV